MDRYKKIIELLDDFINKGLSGTNHTKAMETAIDTLNIETDFVDNFLHDLAFYNPGGGEHLLDYQAFLPKAKRALEYFENQANVTA